MTQQPWDLATVTLLRSRRAKYVLTDQEMVGAQWRFGGDPYPTYVPHVLVRSLIEDLPALSVIGVLQDVQFGIWKMEVHGTIQVTAQWSPRQRPVRLVGGPADGRVYSYPGAPDEPLAIEVMPGLLHAPAHQKPPLELFYEEPPIEPVETVRSDYRLSGWDPVQRHWLYSMEE